MEFASLTARCPELISEIRTLTTTGLDLIPADSYHFVEMYCTTTDCDCRRVMISVISDRRKRQVATLGYGWESRDFYVRWMGLDDEWIDALHGFQLPPTSPQENIGQSLALLALFEQTMRSDGVWIERIKRHYAAFKAKEPKKVSALPSRQPEPGRNAACPCGSGKKYKRCCREAGVAVAVS